jgi:chromosome segregation ATPase
MALIVFWCSMIRKPNRCHLFFFVFLKAKKIMLHVASLRKRATMDQVVRSATRPIGVGKCADTEAELKKLKGEISKMRADLDSNASLREDNEKRLIVAEQRSSDIDSERHKLEAKLAEVNAEKDKVAAHSVAEISAHIEATKKQVIDLTKKLEISDQLYATYKSKINALERDKKQSERTHAEKQVLATKVSGLKAKMYKEKLRNTELKEKLTKLSLMAVSRGETIRLLHIQARGKLKTQLKQRKALVSQIAEINKLNERASANASTIESQTAELAWLNDNLASLDVELRKDKEHYTKLSELFDRVKQEHQRLVVDLTSNIEAYNKDLEQLKTEARLNQEFTNELNEQKTYLQANLDEATKKSEDLKDEVDNLKSSESSYHQRILELQKESEHEKVEILNLNESIKELGNNIRENDKKALELSDLIRDTLTLEKKSDEHLSEVKSKLRKFEKDQNELTKELSSAKSTIQSQATNISKNASAATKRQTELTDENNKLKLQLRSLQSDCESTKKRVRELERAGNSREDETSALKTKVRSLEEMIANIQSQISHCDDQISLLRRNHKATIERHTKTTSEMKLMIEDVLEKLTKAEDLNKVTSKKLKDTETHVADLTGRLDVVRSEMQQLVIQLTDLENTKATLEKEINQSKDELQADRKKHNFDTVKSTAKINELTADVNQKESRIAELERTLSEIKATIETYEDEVSRLRTTQLELKNEARRQDLHIQQIGKQIDDGHLQLSSCKIDNSRLVRDMRVSSEAHQKELADLRSQLLASQELYDKEKESNDTLRSGLIDNERALSDTRESHTHHSSEMSIKMKEAHENVQKAETELHAANKELDKKKTEITELSNKIEALSKDTNELRSLKHTLSDTRKQLKSQVDLNKALETRAVKANATIRTLEQEVSRLTDIIGEVKNAAYCKDDDVVACITNLSGDLKQCQSGAATSAREAIELHSRLHAMNTEIGERTESIKQARRTIEELERELSLVRAVNSETTMQTKELKTQEEKLNNELHEAKSQMSTLKAESAKAVAHAEQEITRISIGMNSMEHTQRVSRKTVEDLQQRLVQALGDKSKHEGELLNKEEKNNELQYDIAKLQSSNDALRLQITEANNDLAVAKESNAAAKVEQKALEDERSIISEILAGGSFSSGDEPHVELTGVAGQINTIRNELCDVCPRGSDLVKCARTLKDKLIDSEARLNQAVTENDQLNRTQQAKIQDIVLALACEAKEDPYSCINRHLQTGQRIIKGAMKLGYSKEDDILSSIASKTELDAQNKRNDELTMANTGHIDRIAEQNIQINAQTKQIHDATEKAKQVDAIKAIKATLAKKLDEAQKELGISATEVDKLGQDNMVLRLNNEKLSIANNRLDEALRDQAVALASHEQAARDLEACTWDLEKTTGLYREKIAENEEIRQEFNKMQETIDAARNTKADLFHAKASVITCALESLRCMLKQHAGELEQVIRKAAVESVQLHGQNINTSSRQERYVFYRFVIPLIAKYRRIHAIESENTMGSERDKKKNSLSTSSPAEHRVAQVGEMRPTDESKPQQSNLDSKSAPNVSSGKHKASLAKMAIAPNSQPKGRGTDYKALALESSAEAVAGKQEKKEVVAVSTSTEAIGPNAANVKHALAQTPEDTIQIHKFQSSLSDSTNVDFLYKSLEIQEAVDAVGKTIRRLLGHVSIRDLESNVAKSEEVIAEIIKLHITATINAIFNTSPSTKSRLIFGDNIVIIQSLMKKKIEMIALAQAAQRERMLTDSDHRELDEIMELNIDHSGMIGPDSIDDAEITTLRGILMEIDERKKSSTYKNALICLLLLTRLTINAESQRQNDKLPYDQAVEIVHNAFSIMTTEPDPKLNSSANLIISGIRSEVEKTEGRNTNKRIDLQSEILKKIDEADNPQETADDKTSEEVHSNDAIEFTADHLVKFLTANQNKTSRSATPLPDYGNRGSSSPTTSIGSYFGSFV